MATKTDKPSATPNLDIMLGEPPAFVKCRLKEGQQPHFVRKGMVVAGDEFVTTGKHAKELFEVGAVDVLGTADEPDKAPAQVLSEAAAKAEGNPAALAKNNPPAAATGEDN